jgi:hypothetical protein
MKNKARRGRTWLDAAPGLPIAVAAAGASADERETLLNLLAAEPELVAPGSDRR